MPIGDPGKEQFRNIIVEGRNLHIAAGLSPLMLMREELTTNDDLTDRGGMDTSTQTHLIELLVNADRWRRVLTYNPGDLDLGDKIAKAIDVNATIENDDNPMGGDDIQMPSGGLFQLPWAFDGTDVHIPLNSILDIASGNGVVLLGIIDKSIVVWSRLNSRDRTMFITQKDSMRVYGMYQQILGHLTTFGGDENRVDVAQVRAGDEPRGPENSANRRTESANPGNA